MDSTFGDFVYDGRFSNALPLNLVSVDYVHVFNESTWDADLGHMCLCDSSWSVGLQVNQTQQAEYFGPACQYRHCPTGDDPASTVSSLPYIFCYCN